MRRMSFSSTIKPMHDRTKTVTRRDSESWGGLEGPRTSTRDNNVESPGFLPSNGTHGDIFRHNWCDACTRDHENHGPHGVTGPGCQILCAGMTAYPGPGPKEWERRIHGDIHDPATWEFEERCTSFEECTGCAAIDEADRLKVWPIETGQAWKPTHVAPVSGQLSLIGR